MSNLLLIFAASILFDAQSDSSFTKISSHNRGIPSLIGNELTTSVCGCAVSEMITPDEVQKIIPTNFWLKIKLPENKYDCWEWQAGKNQDGYGMANFYSKKVKTSMAIHRYVYIALHPDFNKKLYVLHLCDTPSCCNPNHLFAGTQQDNMDDMRSKNRNPNNIGSNHPNAKLTEADIPIIRKRIAANESMYKIAADYNVKEPTICGIKTKKYWKHIK